MKTPASEPRQRFTFKKGERLHHKSLVEGLFRDGRNLYEYPLRLTWRMLDSETLEKCFRRETPQNIFPLQMMVTVPKKKRKKAVDRVLMRRRIREAYRINRSGLSVKVNLCVQIRTLQMAFVYIHNENLPYKTIEEKMKLLLHKVGKQIDRLADKKSES